jgi:hypothetical protein
MTKRLARTPTEQNSGVRTCSSCGGPGPFNKRRDSADGLNRKCRTCTKKSCDAWRVANPEATKRHTRKSNKRKVEKNPEKYRELNQKYSAAWQRAHPEWVLHKAAKSRARSKGLPFTIERTDVVIPTHCPLLGTALLRADVRVQPNSPTLDRVIPSLGYVKGNVWVISHRANVIKNDATLAELETLVANLRRLRGARFS